MMLAAVGKSAAQCFSRSFLATLAKAFIVALVLLSALTWLLLRAVGLLPATPWSWLNTALEIVEKLGAFAAVFLLAGPVAMMTIGFFLDEAALKVERRYYPQAGPPRHVPFIETMAGAAGLASLSLLLNLVALPVYLFLPGLNLALYFVLNGTLIGREYYVLAAARRLAPEPARKLRRRESARIFLAGCLVAFLLLIPGANLVAPLFGTALMVHLVEHLRGGAASPETLVAGARPAHGEPARGVRDDRRR